MPLLNIARTDDQPLFIDPAQLTVITINDDKSTITLYNGEGQLLHIDPVQWNTDLKDLLKKMDENGTPLHAFTSRWPDGNNGFNEHVTYISPAAFTFATISQADDKTGAQGAIFG